MKLTGSGAGSSVFAPDYILLGMDETDLREGIAEGRRGLPRSRLRWATRPAAGRWEN